MSDIHPHPVPPLIKSECHSVRSTRILGVRVDIITREDMKLFVFDILRNKRRGWFSYINIYTLDVAYHHPWFNQFVDKALLSYCDGEGIRFGARLLGEHIPERVTLSDFIYDVAKLAEKEHFSMYLLGSTQETLQETVTKLKSLYPELDICGYHHGYFDDAMNASIIEDINNNSPDILILGMGVPKQEMWLTQNYAKLNTTLAWAGGGVFDFVAGTIKRCPSWLGRIGLEWFYRLLQEPRRLWRRYLLGNSMFLIRILHQRFAK